MMHVAVFWGITVYMQTQEPSQAFTALVTWMGVGNLVAKVVALVGVGYAAIASHHKHWGPALVIAWILSVGAIVLEPQPFIYTIF